jgi:hypothetical protein
MYELHALGLFVFNLPFHVFTAWFIYKHFLQVLMIHQEELRLENKWACLILASEAVESEQSV